MKTEKNLVSDTEAQEQTVNESGLPAGPTDDRYDERDAVAVMQIFIKGRLASDKKTKGKQPELARKAA